MLHSPSMTIDALLAESIKTEQQKYHDTPYRWCLFVSGVREDESRRNGQSLEIRVHQSRWDSQRVRTCTSGQFLCY